MDSNMLKISILPSEFVKKNGQLDKEKALDRCGKIAGVCYNKEGFKALENEAKEKTNKRIDMTLNNGHHSVYDHINISLNMKNIPKILAMAINNEKQYTTSEKSARYTPVEKKEGSIITDKEAQLYSKWIKLFKVKIKEKYGDVYNDTKITKLAQENARYLVTVFMPTEMIYTTTLRQINYIVSVLDDYQKQTDFSKEFGGRMYFSIESLNKELEKLNLLDERLMKNEKNRELSLFKHDEVADEYFGNIYETSYKGTLAQLAQAQRHRTIDYSMNFLDKSEFFIPPIIEDDAMLVDEWLQDMEDVDKYTPQGEKVLIHENGTYQDFILKCKERLCSCAQLEINNQTKATMTKYYQELTRKGHPLKDKIEPYTHGARCTFPDYQCSSDCNFKEGKILQRKI